MSGGGREGASVVRTRPVLRPGEYLFDGFAAGWESARSRRMRAWAILLTFVGVVVWIELGRLGVLPERLVVDKPFGYAIHAAFTLVLVTEVFEMVLSLPRSVAESAGKQFDLFSLILLRQAFEEFSHRGDGIEWEFGWDSPVAHMVADIGGAVAIFALVAFYKRIQLHRRITSGDVEQWNFVAAKKSVAVFLMVAFVALAVMSLAGQLGFGERLPLLKTFYVVLIFSDVLVVLLAMRFTVSHAVVFRNAGFAACTLLIRVALSAPPYLNALVGIVAAGLLIALAAAYRYSISGPGGSVEDVE